MAMNPIERTVVVMSFPFDDTNPRRYHETTPD
jgi:hypothetical protein